MNLQGHQLGGIEADDAAKEAVIYCRVSSDRQVKEGSGLGSQEQRCRAYATSRGYRVLAVFGDEGVSGAALTRPGISALLEYLTARPKGAVVVIDDISRIARDVRTHLELRAAIAGCGASLESPSMRFEESAAGEFIEMVLAASAQFGRKGNREQVMNRQKARLQLGYWTFGAPLGYKFGARPGGKTLLTPVDGARHTLAQSLEAFADGRLDSKRDLARDLQARGFFSACRDGRSGSREEIGVLESRVDRMLAALPLYAGFIEYPKWDVPRVPGHHEAVITEVTLNRIETRLRARAEGRSPLPHRCDGREEFPLRHFVRCAGCGRPFTGCLAKGKYPRYLCYAQGRCERYGHSISARLMEPAFEALLGRIRPSDIFFTATCARMLDAWDARVENMEHERASAAERVAEKQAEIDALVRRLGRTTHEDVAGEIERTVLDSKRELWDLRAAEVTLRGSQPSLEGALTAVSTFACHPLEQWKTGSLSQKRTVHRMVFAVPPTFDRIQGFSTYELKLLYRISAMLRNDVSRLVEIPEETWHLCAEEILELERNLGPA